MGFRIAILTASLLLLGYAAYSLYAGWIISTWGQVVYRPSVLYWVSVIALLVLGGANLVVSIRLQMK